MAKQPAEALGSSPLEIVFDCTNCGKSLSIDSRACGMMVTCPHCDSNQEVPAVEHHTTNMMTDVRDFRIEELETALESSNARMKELTSLLKEYSSRRTTLEEMRSANMNRFKELRQEVTKIQKSLSRIVDTLEEAFEDGQG